MSVIALDARKYFDFGIGTYIRHLIREYVSMQSDREFLLYLGPEEAKTIVVPSGWKTCVVPYGKYSLSELFLLGRKVRASNISVYHSPHYTLPFGLASRSVVTVHDLIHLRFPQFFSPLHRAYSYVMIRHAVQDSQFVITDSEFTKLDILRSFRIKEEKIIPIHLGVSKRFKVVDDPSKIAQFRSRFGLSRQYILFVGNTKPHKGLEVLLRAFKSIIPVFPEVELVFVGGLLNNDKRLESILSQPEFTGKVKALGTLSDEDLVLAYNAAEMLVLPSLYEGFGLPALEAMACGIPVIVSNAGSLPEIVGDAAIVCETGNHGSFAEAMTSLLRDPQLKNRLIELGKKHVVRFSWQLTAQKTMNVYDRIG
jgi:Glycosyltransferase